jgi:hypothetical protein
MTSFSASERPPAGGLSRCIKPREAGAYWLTPWVPACPVAEGAAIDID